MDTSPSSHPGSPAAKISTPPTPGGNHSTEVDHPPRRRRRCPPRAGSGGEPTNSTTTSGRMSVTNSETVEDADMECSDGEAVDTEDEDEVQLFAHLFALCFQSTVLRSFTLFCSTLMRQILWNS